MFVPYALQNTWPKRYFSEQTAKRQIDLTNILETERSDKTHLECLNKEHSVQGLSKFFRVTKKRQAQSLYKEEDVCSYISTLLHKLLSESFDPVTQQ